MSDGVIGYRIVALVGEGGFGKVYRARQESSGGFTKDVAIKILHDDEPRRALLTRFRDEARILGLVRDRSIVKVEPPVELGGRWAVVMEWVDGTSLRDVIDQLVTVPPSIALEVVEEVARALDNAFHQEVDGQALQLLHRDIKPDNIQITPSGEVRLLDFGIARANFAGRESKTKKHFGGTPGYIAPERPEGIEQPAGDVYSLGVVLYESVVGIRSRGAVDMEIDENDLPRIDTEELDLPEVVDDTTRKVLELSGWMRSADHVMRPSARELENACRTLRAEIGGPILRDWAATNVPQRAHLKPDQRVGKVFEVMGGTPAPVPTRDPVSLPPPPEDPSSTRIAVGGLMAGGLGLGVGLGLVGLAVVLMAGALAVVASQQPAEAPPIPAPVEVEPSPVPEPVPPGPDAAPAPAPVPDAPTPTPAPAPVERVIVLPGSEAPKPASPTPTPTPTPSPEPAPTPVRAVGTLVVRTVPTGASVQRAGQTLKGQGNRYELPVGSHALTLVSPSGERAPLPVSIRKGAVTEICYSFDTNGKCTQ